MKTVLITLMANYHWNYLPLGTIVQVQKYIKTFWWNKIWVIPPTTCYVISAEDSRTWINDIYESQFL